MRRAPVKANSGLRLGSAQISLSALLLVSACGGANVRTQEQAGWPAVSGSNGGGRYAALTEINKDNVSGLRVAWEFRTGDYDRGRPG
jgi:glucose dehydrogenase